MDMMADANLIAGIATSQSRLEILDWYHLVENLVVSQKQGSGKVRKLKTPTLLFHVYSVSI
jgi:hypothetical protein